MKVEDKFMHNHSLKKTSKVGIQNNGLTCAKLSKHPADLFKMNTAGVALVQENWKNLYRTFRSDACTVKYHGTEIFLH